MVELGVGVHESIADVGVLVVVVVDKRENRHRQHLVPRAAQCHRIGSLALENRTAEAERTRGEPEAERSAVTLHVALAGVHVHERRQATIVFRRKRRLVEVHIADGLGVERREQAAEMVNLVERHVVEHIQVFVGVAAMDIHPRHGLGSGRNAGLKLEALDDVALAEHHRGGLDFGGREVVATDFGRFVREEFIARAHHDHFLELFHVLFRFESVDGEAAYGLRFWGGTLLAACEGDVVVLDFPLYIGITEHLSEHLAQGLVLCRHAHLHALEQIRGIDEILARLAHELGKHRLGRGIPGSDGHLLGDGGPGDGQHPHRRHATLTHHGRRFQFRFRGGR